MSADRIAILHALAPLKGSAEAWTSLIEAWPGDTLEEGRAFWDLLKPTSIKGQKSYSWEDHVDLAVYRALEKRFGAKLWTDPSLDPAPWEVAYKAFSGLAVSEDTGYAGKSKHTLPLFQFFLDRASSDHIAQARLKGRWIAPLTKWLHRPSPDHVDRNKLIHTLFQKGWVDPRATMADGQPLALALRHPADVEAWLAGRGEPEQKGVDPSQPDAPLWALWHQAAPMLAEVIVKHVPAAGESLGSQPSLKRADDALRQLERLRAKSGKITAERWWATLTDDHDWVLLRDPRGQAPLWQLALFQCPALLPRLCQEVSKNPVLEAHLGDQDIHGRGVWHILLRKSDSRSLSLPLLTKLAAWTPPTDHPALWVGSPLNKDDSAPLGVDYDMGYAYRGYAQADLHKVLLPDVIFGTPAQRQRLVDEWSKQTKAWELMFDSIRLGKFSSLLDPSLQAIGRVAVACASLNEKMEKNMDVPKNAVEQALKALSLAPADTAFPPDMLKTLKQKAAAFEKELQKGNQWGAVQQLVGALHSHERQRSTPTFQAPKDGSAVRRVRHRN